MNSTMLCAAGNLLYRPLDGNTTLLLNRRSGGLSVVTSDVAASLQVCQTFSTPDDHAARIVSAMPSMAGNAAAVSATLQQLAQSGVLDTGDTTCGRLKGVGHQGEASRARAFILTRDRPDAVQRLLDSLIELPGLSRLNRLFLIDDSREDDSIRRNADLAERFSTHSAVEIRHITPGMRAELLDRLAALMPDHRDGLRFLLDRGQQPDFPSYGTSRNWCQLLSLGHHAVMLDDDILPYRLKPVVEGSGLRIRGGVQSEARFFPSMQAVLDRIDALEGSAVNSITDCLGLPFAQAAERLAGAPLQPQHLLGAPGIIVDAIDADSRVLVSQCGTFGDPGTEGALWLSGLDGASRNSLIGALGGPGGSALERCCWRGTSVPTLMKMPSMSQLTGLDNTQLLPPYFPYFRGEDLLFGASVDFIHPRAVAVEHAWCIAHLPVSRRPAIDLGAPERGSGSPLGVIARQLSERVDTRSGLTPAARCHQLADVYRGEAARSDHDLVMHYREAHITSTSELLEQIHQQWRGADGAGSPVWKAFLQESANTLGQALQQVPDPGQWVGGGPDADPRALGQVRNMMTGYAEGLEAWVALRESAGSGLDAVLSSAIGD